MEVKQILHMNKGNGETSYAKNSTVQRKTLSIAKPIIEEAVLQLLGSNVMGIESMGIADLGCSSGLNTLLISQIMDVIHANKLSKVTELRVSLNDLFSNDFNSIFLSLPSFYNKLKQEHYNNGRDPNLFISAVPGSFYGPLFPRKSVHFVHSSFSVHWLSQVPIGLNNKGKIYVSKTSPQCVLDAYSIQFQKDFSVFLRSRAQEIVAGGRMVLSLMGRPSSDPTADEGTFYQFELLGQALMAMVSKGLIEEEKVNSFNIPYYASCVEELELVLEKEGSFSKDRLEAFGVDWDTDGIDLDLNMLERDDQLITSSGQRMANSIRVVTESMLEFHFGKGRKTLSITAPIIENAVLQLLGSNIIGTESMGIADLGCSSGPSTLLLMSQIMDVMHAKRSKVTELSRPSSNPTADEGTFYQFELLAYALMAMVFEGLIEEEKVNSFINLPYYTSCEEELNLVFQKEGSFIEDQLEAFQVDWDTCVDVIIWFNNET
ncbi:hypothetical protein ACLB2K_043045 [Fragaria x ananassa]